MTNFKHLSLEDRFTIASMLNDHASFKKIAHSIGRDASTISKEIRNNLQVSQTGAYNKPFNPCAYRSTCSRAALCKSCDHPKQSKNCRFCSSCITVCDTFKPVHCPLLDRPPYVCNGCSERPRCTLEKHVYSPSAAQQKYRHTLSESRSGISLSEDEVKELDALFSPLIKQGQSIHHIFVNHAPSIMVSEGTVYNLIDYNLFDARNIDLPRRVRFSKRKKKKTYKVEKSCRINRSYIDYLSFMREHPDLPVTEIDSVEGRKGGKVLLTVHFVRTECMIAFIRDHNDAASVNAAFEHLYSVLSGDVFRKVFPVLLGDNGSEFSNPSAIEFDADGMRRTNLFYCDPSAPHQKGSAERNHEFIRLFVPKGKSFDDLTQEDVDLMMSHIASYSRPSLLDKTPYEMMSFYYGEEVCSALNLKRIAPDDVTLNKSIWKNDREVRNNEE